MPRLEGLVYRHNLKPQTKQLKPQRFLRFEVLDLRFEVAAALLIGCMAAGPARAVTYTTADCSESAFQNAVNSASDGDTVQGPAAGGSAVWTGRLNTTKSLILNGNGCVITLSQTDAIRMVSTNASVHPRITNFTFTSSDTSCSVCQAAIWVEGNNPNFRVDHNIFTNLPRRVIVVDYGTNEQYKPQTCGVIDHNTITNTNSYAAINLYGQNENWLSDPNFGTANAMYFEDNTISWNTGTASSNQSAIDCEHGGRYVFRHNHLTNGYISMHDTGSTPMSRACRIAERYDNDLHCTVTDGTCYGAMGYRGGTAMDFNNQIPISASGSGGWQNAGGTEIKRLTCEQTQQCGPPMDFGVHYPDPHAVCSSFRGWCSTGNQGCNGNSDCASNYCNCGSGNSCPSPPNDAACGTGVVSIANIDGPGSPTGYPARDQTGVGKDDPTTHAQTAAVNPAYSWINIDPNHGNAVITGMTMVNNSGTGNYILPNREYYQQVVPFSGVNGVGVGVLSARTTSCTPRVAYWATDQSKLYVCTATNTWTAYYTPYTYPHPLVGGGGGGYSACDLNRDNSTNVIDVQLEVNMALGVTPCTADINKDGACNVVDVQRVVNAALGGQCVTGP